MRRQANGARCGVRRTRRVAAAWAVAMAALAASPAAAVDLDDPEAEPLHVAVETLSADAVTGSGGVGGGARYYNVRAPDGTALASTTKLALPERDRWYLRVDLDGMVFSRTPVLTTTGDGAGSGFESTDDIVVDGGAGAAYAIYRLPDDSGFARGLTFSVSLAEALAVPGEEGAYGAAMALHDDFSGALERDGARSYSAFGGEATAVVVTSGVAIGIERGFAVADFEDDFLGFVPESASGDSTDPDNPSAPAVLGSVSVGAVEASPDRRRPPVHSARTGEPVTAADVIESVSVAVAGDMTFGTLDFRIGTAGDRCLRTSPATAAFPGGGVLPLSPPDGEDTVTTLGTATLRHADEAWRTRHLCVWLPEPEAGQPRVRIPIVFYEATVTVATPFGGALVREETVGVIGRRGARVDIATLTVDARYDQVIVISNRGRSPVRYVFDTFSPPAGVEVTLAPAAAAEGGLNTVGAESMVVLRVAETLGLTGPDDALTAATLWFNAAADDIGVAVVQTNRGDGSTDTTVYPARPSIRPADPL